MRTLLWMMIACALTVNAADLPELPRVDTANFLPVIRTQVEQAAAEARAHPRDAKAAGALAMTLHAYQQYDGAARAYSRAHVLQPQNFDWLYLLGNVQIKDVHCFRGQTRCVRRR